MYSEQLATSRYTTTNWNKEVRPEARPKDGPPTTHGLIVKAADPKTSSQETKRIIKEAVDPKALQLGVNEIKIKKLSNEAMFVECKTGTDRGHSRDETEQTEHTHT